MKAFKLTSILLMLFGVGYLTHTSYILSKAYLANYLIEEAWRETLKTGKNHKAWSWADSYPIAKLKFIKQNISQVVLEEAIGRNMAFAPSRIINSGKPGQMKSTVISAHNDTHFYHLKDIVIGEIIEIETTDGIFQYQVDDIKVINANENKIPIKQSDELILTTCFPFDQIRTGTPLRYVVKAILIT